MGPVPSFPHLLRLMEFNVEPLEVDRGPLRAKLWDEPANEGGSDYENRDEQDEHSNGHGDGICRGDGNRAPCRAAECCHQRGENE